jgi:hypothetical protein
LPIFDHFYVEQRGAAGWVLPPRFVPESWTFECNHPFGEFAWARSGRGWLTLFWGPHALFPMCPGPPDDRRGSALLRHLDRFYDYQRNEDHLCWLPYPELLIDCWDTDWVTVWAKVPAQHALLFGDGQQEFPEAELLAAGIPEVELDHLRNGRLTEEPVDVTFGRQRFRLADLPPDYEVEVTWRATIAEFIGEPHAGLFKGLRGYGPDEELRILSLRG